jgi:hypothetical protein
MNGEDIRKLGLDTVQLRATKDGNSEVVILTRATAELRRTELEAEDWSVEITDVADRGSRNGSPPVPR